MLDTLAYIIDTRQRPAFDQATGKAQQAKM